MATKLTDLYVRHAREIEDAIRAALDETDGRIKPASEILGVSYSTLHGLIQRSPALRKEANRTMGRPRAESGRESE